MKNFRLKKKLLLGSTLISILLALMTMLAISGLISLQYNEQANDLQGKAISTLDDQLTELKNNQSLVSSQLANQKSFVSTLWYLSKYRQSGVAPEMLLLTHQQLVKEINKLSLNQKFSTVMVYAEDGHLVAFVGEKEQGRLVGFTSGDNRSVLQVAKLQAGEELNRDNVHTHSSADGLGFDLHRVLPQRDTVRYVIADGMIAIETQTRVQGDVPDASGAMKLSTVGWLVTMQPLRQNFASKLSKLTDTKINLFTPRGFSAGELPTYQHLGQSEMDAKNNIAFSEVSVDGEQFYQAVMLLREGEKRVGAIVALHSKKVVQKNVREMIEILGVIALVSLLMIIPFVRYFANSISRPLITLNRIFQDVAMGKADGALKAKLAELASEQRRDDELGDLTKSFIAMEQAVRQKISLINEINDSLESKVAQRTQELRIANEALTRQAMHDVLTGLPNRQLLGDRLTHSLVAAQRDKSSVALMFIDLDEFKPVNDRYGHAVGDLLLKEAASRIQHCVRASDTVSRIGGDEFVVLLLAVEGANYAVEVAGKICHSMQQPFELQDHQFSISASIGVTLYPELAGNESDLFRQADLAMYEAKNNGRNQVCLFQPQQGGQGDTEAPV